MNTWRQKLIPALLLAIVPFSGCIGEGDGGSNTGAPVAVTGVVLNKTATTILVSGTEQLGATIAPSNATNQEVTWSSDNTPVAEVSTTGLVTGVAAGTAIITATTDDGGFTANCTVTVSGSAVPVTGISLNKTATTILISGTEQLGATIAPSNATNQNLTWSSDDIGVADVSTTGLVSGVATGTATITVTTGDGGFTATCTVTVAASLVPVTDIVLNKTSTSLLVDGTEQLTPTISPANATNQSVSWSSDESTVADVSNAGLVTAKAAGTAIITATTDDGGLSATCTVTVSLPPVPVTGVALNKTATTILVGSTEQLTPTVSPADADNPAVTWSTSKGSVASVSVAGLVTANAGGTATITATTDDGGHVATCEVTVYWPTAAEVSTGTLTKTIYTISLIGNLGTAGTYVSVGTVILSPYLLGRSEVSYAQWYEVKTWAAANGYTFLRSAWEGCTQVGGTPSGKQNEPVTNISWRDAIVWCNALSQKEGLTPCYSYNSGVIKDASNATACDNAVLDMNAGGYRLPTEAEWEYAARYIDGSTWTPWDYLAGATGNYNDDAACLAVGVFYYYRAGTNPTGVTKTANVESKILHTAIGFHDLSGNVWEWCADWYSATIPGGVRTNPTGPEPNTGTQRVRRGGSWYEAAAYCETTFRYQLEPQYGDTYTGFRVARTQR